MYHLPLFSNVVFIFTKICGWPQMTQYIKLPGRGWCICCLGFVNHEVLFLLFCFVFSQLNQWLPEHVLVTMVPEVMTNGVTFSVESSKCFREATFKPHKAYVYSDVWLKFYTCLYYTWIVPGIIWIVDGETWSYMKIIWFRGWFPKQDSDNS